MSTIRSRVTTAPAAVAGDPGVHDHVANVYLGRQS